MIILPSYLETQIDLISTNRIYLIIVSNILIQLGALHKYLPLAERLTELNAGVKLQENVSKSVN